MRVQKGISTHLFVYDTFNEGIIRLIKKYGFEAIEIWGMRPHIDYYDEEGLKDLAEAMKKVEIKAVSFHAPVYAHVSDAKEGKWLSLSDRDGEKRRMAIEETKKVVDAMEVFGANILVVHCGNTGDKKEPGILGNFHSSLSELIIYCKEKGVRLAIENILNDLSTSSAMKEISDRYNYRELGICLDLGHANILGDLVSVIEDLGERIISLHVVDNDGKEDSHLLPFQGNIPWDRVRMALEKVGYTGAFMYEPRNYGDAEAILKGAAESYERIFGRND